MKKNILLFFQVPPPIHGVTVMNQHILESKEIQKQYNVSSIKISYGLSIRGLGKFNIFKILKIFKYIWSLFYKLFFFKPDIIFFTITPCGVAFLRDSIYVFIMKMFRVKIIYHLHGKGISKYYRRLIYKILYKYVFNNSKIILLSKKLEYDISNIVSSKHIYYLSNGRKPSNNNSTPNKRPNTRGGGKKKTKK